MGIGQRSIPGSSPGLDPGGSDGGFSLVETIVGLVMLAVVTTAAAPVLISSLQSSTGLGEKQAAVTVASQQLEYVRTITPANLVKGRNSTNVATLVATPTLVDFSNDLTGSGSGNSDSAAVNSTSASVPLTTTTTLNGVVYTARTFIDLCYYSQLTGTCNRLPLNGPDLYRVSVDVAWPKKPGVACLGAKTGQCDYVATTLIDASDDPIFSTSPGPTITSVDNTSTAPTSQLSSLHAGQQVTLQFNGTNFAYGAYVYSGQGDQVAAVTNNTGTALTVTLQASSSLGSRPLAVVNPNGSSATTTFSVTPSAPTITTLSPTTVTGGTATTFTLTGSDYYLTPSAKPTITLVGTGKPPLLSAVAVSPTTSAVTIPSKTSLTFAATFPTPASLFGAGTTLYTASGTLTLTNPDGGGATYSYSLTVR